MRAEDIRVRLTKYIEQRSYIQVERVGDFPYGCIPVSMSDELIMTLRFRDFEPEGYEIFPLKAIERIRRSNVETYFGRIVRMEGAEKLLDASPDIKLQDWTSVFAFLKKTGENVVVEVGSEDCCHVGRVIGTSGNRLRIRCFSPTGVWDDADWTEPCENIASIQFRTHYVEMFAKYMPPLKL